MDAQLCELEGKARDARKALKAVDRLLRIATHAVADLDLSIQQLRQQCEAEGGKAHDHQRDHHREPALR